MSLNPITREEKFLAKAGGEDVGELKPITRREQFLARLAGGGSGGGGGASSWDDLKNKPFEVLEEAEAVLPETTIQMEVGDDGVSVGAIAEPLEVEADKEYKVVWCGSEYKCIAQPFDMEGVPTNVLGNLGLITGGVPTGEPFILIILPAEAGGGVQILDLYGGTETTLSITKAGIIKKLDNKFLDLEWLPADVRKEKTLYKDEALRIPSSGFFMEDSALFDLIEGETYKVTFNGETYECVCEKTYGTYGDYQTEVYSIGNLTMKNGASDYDTSKEPFLYELAKVLQIGHEMANFTAYAYKNDDVSISVVGSVFEAEPLPEKFLPAGVGGGGAFIVNFETTDGQTFTADKTIEEIKEAFGTKNVVGVLKMTIGGTSAYSTLPSASLANGILMFTYCGYGTDGKMVVTTVQYDTNGIVMRNGRIATS